MSETKPTIITEKGDLTFNNHLELGSAASLMITTKLAPQHLIKEGREAVCAALLLCKQFQLPQKSMYQMAFIKGKLTCYGSLVSAIVMRHKDWGKKKELFVNESCEEICLANKNLKDKAWAAVIQIQKKGETEWSEYFFSIDDAKLAGLDDPKKFNGSVNVDSPWLKYTKDMLKHKVRKRAFDAEFASALEGLEYYQDLIEMPEAEIKDVTPQKEIELKIEGDEKLEVNPAIEEKAQEILEENDLAVKIMELRKVYTGKEWTRQQVMDFCLIKYKEKDPRKLGIEEIEELIDIIENCEDYNTVLNDLQVEQVEEPKEEPKEEIKGNASLKNFAEGLTSDSGVGDI